LFVLSSCRSLSTCGMCMRFYYIYVCVLQHMHAFYCCLRLLHIVLLCSTR
jgi:hypothetical protein